MLFVTGHVNITCHVFLESFATMRMAPIKKVLDCEHKGFQKMQGLLQEGKQITCKICLQMLGPKFDAEKLHDFIEQALAEGKVPELVEQAAVADGVAELEDEDAAGENEDEVEDASDPFRFARLFPFIKLHPAGAYGKKFPYQCTVCVTRKAPMGKIGDLTGSKHETVKCFLSRHLECPTHKANYQIYLQKKEEVDAKMVDCPALCASDPRARYICKSQDVFGLWISHANLNEFAKHKYWQDENGGPWRVRSRNCKKFVPASQGHDGPSPCSECMDLGKSHGVMRTAFRFAEKYYEAEALSARVFGGEALVEELFDKLRASSLFIVKPKFVQDLYQKKVTHLQQNVRESFLCERMPSPALQRFIATVVQPACRVNVSAVPDRLADVAAKFAAIIASGDAQDQDLANLKMASACMTGKLDEHPLIQGLLLQLRRKLDKASRGITSMRGRRDKETQVETEAIKTAGLELAILSGSMCLAREFGLPMASMRTSLDELDKHSLPSPALALVWPEVMESNVRLVDQRYPRGPNEPKSVLARLAYCYYTYLIYFNLIYKILEVSISP